MPKDLVTAEEVTQAIMHRITTGQYAPGDPLPSVRDLAQEIGSNRNTVNKAYQMLLEFGVIESKPHGRRGFSVKKSFQSVGKTKTELLEYFYQQSVELVWHGMAAGISAETMLDTLKSAVGDVYGHSEVRLIFFECNDHDTTEMGRHLNETLGMRVEFKNLDFFTTRLQQVTANYDLIITTYHHLAEMIQALKANGQPTNRLVGIETRPTPETMLRVARLPGQRIGIVCTNQNTAHMLKHIFYGYHPEWQIEAASLEAPEPIAEIVTNSDHFVVTHTSATAVAEYTSRIPDVVVNFQIDEQSMAFLQQRIYDIQMQKMSPLHSLVETQQSSGA